MMSGVMRPLGGYLCMCGMVLCMCGVEKNLIPKVPEMPCFQFLLDFFKLRYSVFYARRGYRTPQKWTVEYCISEGL